MTQYLVAADADQIQDLLLRASQLREVAGGSVLLREFGDDVGRQWPNNSIVHAGGNFRLRFPARESAIEVQEVLAEAYRRRTGGSLTVVGPFEYGDDGFANANGTATHQLHVAKRQREGAETSPHTPYSAFCTSCGLDLAVSFASPTPERAQEQPNGKTYLCRHCQDKAAKRFDMGKLFLGRYFDEMHNIGLDLDFPTTESAADALGSLDPTQYVGYLLADVNNMGRAFGQCRTEAALNELSKRLDDTLWQSLAAPTPELAQRLDELGQMWRDRPPIFPLILGGDDVLAMVPARFALDTARRFGEAFEEKMNPRQCISLAVVICQSHYPYRLAYDYGCELLKLAKRLGKEIDSSSVSFGVIRGNELTRVPPPGGDFLPTLQPYWIGVGANSTQAAENGAALKTLLDCRLKLKDLPGKRRSELQRLFIDDALDDLRRDPPTWDRRLRRIVDRAEPSVATHLGSVLAALGANSNRSSIWKWVLGRYGGHPVQAHGLPDLLEAWDYSYSLDTPSRNYAEEER